MGTIPVKFGARLWGVRVVRLSARLRMKRHALVRSGIAGRFTLITPHTHADKDVTSDERLPEAVGCFFTVA